jgi:hypothetical protein
MTELDDIARWLKEHDDEAAQIAIGGRQLAEALNFDQGDVGCCPDHSRLCRSTKAFAQCRSCLARYASSRLKEGRA